MIPAPKFEDQLKEDIAIQGAEDGEIGILEEEERPPSISGRPHIRSHQYVEHACGNTLRAKRHRASVVRSGCLYPNTVQRCNTHPCRPFRN